MIHVKKILYPTDFSSYSNQAYFHAVALAENHQASLTVLLVHTPDFKAPPQAGKLTSQEFWKAQLEQIRPLNPKIAVNHVFLEGDPSSVIVRYAQDAGIDLIVMGTHGRSGLERLLLGSVAEKVLRDAHCSVLVVKLPKGVSTPRADVEVKGKQ
jgi:nucleotide-binding universal stress UspA family protein